MCATQYHYQFAGSFRRKKAQLSDSTPRHLMYQNDWLMFQTHYFPTKMAVVLFFLRRRRQQPLSVSFDDDVI